MSKLKFQKVAAAAATAPATAPRERRGDVMIQMMQSEAGASAKELADAVGWQVHSVRGFVAGSLRKRADLAVITTRTEGVTRYRVQPAGAGDSQ
jgi:hypothetical protein